MDSSENEIRALNSNFILSFMVYCVFVIIHAASKISVIAYYIPYIVFLVHCFHPKDKSFTCTLFLPFDQFDKMTNKVTFYSALIYFSLSSFQGKNNSFQR